MLSSEELVIVRDMLQQINHTAGYSYTVAVHGVQVVGIISMITTIIWIIAMVFISKYAILYSTKKASETRDGAWYVAGAITIIISAFILWLVLTDVTWAMARIFVPEYVVMSNIISPGTI